MSDDGSIIDRLLGESAPDEDPRAAQFMRGLALGALVGAAIAGSTLLQRRRTRREAPRPDAVDRDEETEGPAGPDD